MAGFGKDIIIVTQELGPVTNGGRDLKDTMQLAAVIKLPHSVFVSSFALACV